MLFQILAFIALSLLLAYFSRSALFSRHYYAKPRFVLWEALLALTILNLPAWFRNPLAPLQLGSWVLLSGSIVLAVLGFRHLIKLGKPQGSIENTTRLASTGAYRFIRHPLYASLLLYGLGAYCKHPSFPATLLLSLALASGALTAHFEEAENLARFGVSYQKYLARTKRFIPFIY